MIETLRYFCGHLKIKELNFICTWIELQRYKTNKKYMAAFKIILDLQNYFGKKKKKEKAVYTAVKLSGSMYRLNTGIMQTK